MIVLPPTALTRMSIAPNSCSTEPTVAVDVGFVKRVAQAAMRPAAGLAQRRDSPVEPLLVVVDGDDDRTLARHDVGGGAADAAGRRGDQRDLVLKAHPLPLSRLPALSAALTRWRGLTRGVRRARGGQGCNSGVAGGTHRDGLENRRRQQARRLADPARWIVLIVVASMPPE